MAQQTPTMKFEEVQRRLGKYEDIIVANILGNVYFAPTPETQNKAVMNSGALPYGFAYLFAFEFVGQCQILNQN